MEKIIRTESRLTADTASALEKSFKEAIMEKPERLVLDMKDTQYISSACLREILKLLKASRANGVSLTFRNVGPTVLEIFEITGFASGLNIEN